MTKPIEDYTADELSAKIEAIKAERERTANALKKYEEELERRKQEVPLGVPLESGQFAGILGTYYFGFASDKEKSVFDGILKDYVKALQKLAKGEQIDIKVLLPLLKKGYVAMDSDEQWFWFKNKPVQEELRWIPAKTPTYSDLWSMRIFNLKPYCNWKDSLMECGL